MVKLPAIVLALLSSGIAAAAPAPPALSPEGLGPLMIGMSEKVAAKRLGLKASPDDGVYSFDCREDEYPRYPGVSVMTERGVITRIVMDDLGPIQTDKGLRIGSKEADVRRAYGSALEISTRPYDDEPAHELIAWAKKARRGIRYDTDANGSVVAIFAGRASIRYIEGCL